MERFLRYIFCTKCRIPKDEISNMIAQHVIYDYHLVMSASIKDSYILISHTVMHLAERHLKLRALEISV